MPDQTLPTVSAGLKQPQIARHTVRSIPVVIERSQDSIKRGTSPSGKPYVRVYGRKEDGSRIPGFVGYGYIPRTLSGDGENLDVYLGDDMSSDMAYVVHQGEPDPELKLMLGWPTAQAARDCYVAHTPAHMMLGITPVPMELLLALLNASPVEKSAKPRFVERMMKTVHEARLHKALECAQAYRQSGASAPGNAPIPMPADFRHDALTLPLTGTYPDPELVGGWLGWIEPVKCGAWGPYPPVGGPIGERGPLARDWIAFVAIDGHALLWQDRDDKGGVCGTPLSFHRPDLIPAPPQKILAREMCGYFVSADDPGTEPTSNVCPLCGEEWVRDNVRTYSLLDYDPPGDVSVFYRTHRTCAEACGESVIGTLDEQALAYARDGTLMKSAHGFGKWVRKSVNGLQPVRKPFAGFPSFGACTARMQQGGHDEASAARICGALEARVKKGDVSTAELLLQAGPPDEWSGAVAGVLGDRKQDVITLWDALSEEQRNVVRRVWGSFFDAETSLLDTAATLMEAQPDLAKSADPPPPTDDPRHDVHLINKAADDEMRYVLGIVLEPLDPTKGEADTQGDSYTADAIRKAQWGYMMHFVGNVSFKHKGFLNGRVYVVDCYTAPVDMNIAGLQVRAGTWLAGFYIPDDEVWGLVKSGELNALSIGGVGKRTPITR